MVPLLGERNSVAPAAEAFLGEKEKKQLVNKNTKIIKIKIFLILINL